MNLTSPGYISGLDDDNGDDGNDNDNHNRTDRVREGQIDSRTDILAYRVAQTHLNKAGYMAKLSHLIGQEQ